MIRTTKSNRTLGIAQKPKRSATPLLTDEQFKVVESAIYATWQYIAADAAEMCDGDNECAIEMCLDADRLTMCVNDHYKNGAVAAEAILKPLYDKPGFSAVCKYLSKRIPLV